MATALLSRYECDRGLLPRRCVQCGTSADGGVSLTGSSRIHDLTRAGQELLVLVLLVCPPLFLILARTGRRRPGVVLPMCATHEADWHWRTRVTHWGFYTLTAVYLFAIAWTAVFWPDDGRDPARAGVFIYLAAAYVWLVLFALIWAQVVGTAAIPGGFRLSRAHPAFLTALTDDRARDSDPNRHQWFGDVRDDYDDAPPGDAHRDGVTRQPRSA